MENTEARHIEDQMNRLQFADNHEHHGCCQHHHHDESHYDSMMHQVEYKITRPQRVFHIEKEFFIGDIKYMQYKDETQMKHIMSLITKDLSEPYSIYTYRYFIHNWPHLSFLVCSRVRRLIDKLFSFCFTSTRPWTTTSALA